jgi:hypothetical protein
MTADGKGFCRRFGGSLGRCVCLKPSSPNLSAWSLAPRTDCPTREGRRHREKDVRAAKQRARSQASHPWLISKTRTRPRNGSRIIRDNATSRRRHQHLSNAFAHCIKDDLIAHAKRSRRSSTMHGYVRPRLRHNTTNSVRLGLSREITNQLKLNTQLDEIITLI